MKGPRDRAGRCAIFLNSVSVVRHANACVDVVVVVFVVVVFGCPPRRDFSRCCCRCWWWCRRCWVEVGWGGVPARACVIAYSRIRSVRCASTLSSPEPPGPQVRRGAGGARAEDARQPREALRALPSWHRHRPVPRKCDLRDADEGRRRRRMTTAAFCWRCTFVLVDKFASTRDAPPSAQSALVPDSGYFTLP